MDGEEQLHHQQQRRLIDTDDTIFVAVGKKLKSKSTVEWAIKSFAKKICLLHVHQPVYVKPFSDGQFSAVTQKQIQTMNAKEPERQKIREDFDEYLKFLSEEGVEADTLWIEMDDILKGILELIRQNDIRWLVMGAASDKYYTRNMEELYSRKAIFICKHAPASCHIWFPCKGRLIYTRGRKNEETIGKNILPLLLLDSDAGTEQLKIASPIRLSNLNLQFSLHYNNSANMPSNTETKQRLISRQDCSHAEEDASKCESRAERCTSRSSASPSSRNSMLLMLKSNSPLPCEDLKAGVLKTGETYGKLPLATVNAMYSETEPYKSTMKQRKAEENATEAIHKAELFESLCVMEIIQRKEMEEDLKREKLEAQIARDQLNEDIKELQMIRERRPIPDDQLQESSRAVKELEEKFFSAVDLLVSLREQRDRMQIEHDNANGEVEKLRKMTTLPATKFEPHLTAFTFAEIIEATHNFDPSYNIGEGRNGSLYQGILRHLHVVIKMLPSYGSQGDLEFQHEVEVLSRVRHPGLVTLIGTCLESRTLIYEYLQHGSLEDHLSRKHNTPLSWQTRIQIIIEICSALIFLHTNKPPIIHGNLKPTKVLLGANFVCKLSDWSMFGLLQHDKNVANPRTISLYADPEFVETGELAPESDVYSFGIIILRLLTGRPVFGLVNDVKRAFDNVNLRLVLDDTAGNWPLEQAELLAYLGLKCCGKNRFERPDLASDVSSVLNSMKNACISSQSSFVNKNEQTSAPAHFVCPIYQEVMKDPHIAADGFTYEGEAIQGWLNTGHDTSPMTNLKLHHCNLLPNYALHYAIQEWEHRY